MNNLLRLAFVALLFLGCSNDDDPIVNNTGLEIYVSDIGNFEKGPWQILKYDGNGQNPQVFISKNLGWPQEILFLEDQGVVLISNFTTGSINKHDISTGEFKGAFASGVGTPTRMKIGPDGLLYVLQWQGNGKVLRYKLDGTKVDEFTDVGVNESIGLDWDKDGNLYVSSFNGGAGGSVRKFDSSGKDQGLFISSGLQGPTNIWFDEAGNLLVNDWQGGAVRKFDAVGKSLGTAISGLSQPEGVDFFENGDFLIGNGGNGSIKMYSKDNKLIKDLVPSGFGGLRKPNAVTIRKLK
ncbi:MAG: hypothetical protein RLN86_13340 [Cyclobacteriaceae bacterium]